MPPSSKNKPHGGNKNPITFYRGFMHTYIIVCHHTFRLIKATLLRVVWGLTQVCVGPLWWWEQYNLISKDDEVKIGWFFPKDKKVAHHNLAIFKFINLSTNCIFTLKSSIVRSFFHVKTNYDWDLHTMCMNLFFQYGFRHEYSNQRHFQHVFIFPKSTSSPPQKLLDLAS